MRTQPYACWQVLLLDGNELTGPLSAEIGRLRHLAYLDLSHNRFYSKLPLALFQCTALAHLRLRDNQFSGTLPAVISRLHKLEVLDIGDNSFSGSIPERSPSHSARSALHHSRSSVNKVGVSCVTNRSRAVAKLEVRVDPTFCFTRLVIRTQRVSSNYHTSTQKGRSI